MDFPEELRYTKQHEWARLQDDGSVLVGITDYAQSKLGDVVYVELPDVGSEVEAEEPFGSVESVKAVSDLYSPVSGTVVEINDSLEDSPESINEDPFGDAWLIRVEVEDAASLKKLMTSAEYREFCESEDE